MSTLTPNYNFILPAVNDPTDQDLWGGYLNSNWSALDTDLKTVSDSVATAGRLPVGSLYFNSGTATNPGTLLGYGTWTAYAAGRVLIGVGTGTDGDGESRTYADGDTGGEYEHTLTTDEIPAHTHTQRNYANTGGSPPFGFGGSDNGVNVQNNIATTSAGGDDPHNNIQPYITVYIWKRTA